MALITIGHMKNMEIQQPIMRRVVDDNILLWIADEEFSENHSISTTLGDSK